MTALPRFVATALLVSMAVNVCAQTTEDLPVTLQPQPREDAWWQERHAAKLAEREARLAAGETINLVFVGDSITHSWEKAGAELWAERFAPYGALNLGYSGDRTEHVLWRIGQGGKENNEIRLLHPKLYVVMIGTNNTGHGVGTPEETAQGIEAIIDQLHAVSPASSILLLGVFPRGATAEDPMRLANDEINRRIGELGQRERVEFMDLSEVFLDENGDLPQSVMPDRLHPNVEGYRLWADAITPKVVQYMTGEADEAL